jgi:hypothetical protein
MTEPDLDELRATLARIEAKLDRLLAAPLTPQAANRMLARDLVQSLTSKPLTSHTDDKP